MPQYQNITEQQEIQEIIGAMPQKIWHRGILIILGVVAGLLTIAYFVPYPDVIEVPIVITTAQPMVEIKTPIGGEIANIFVKNETQIKSGQVLLALKSGANYQQVLALTNQLNKLKSLKNPIETAAFQFEIITKLGSLTAEFETLKIQIKKLKFLIEKRHIPQQISALQAELSVMEKLGNSLQKQIVKLFEKTNITERNFHDYEQLEKDGAASKLELDAAKTNWLQQQEQLEIKNTQTIVNQLNTKKTHKQILLLEQTKDTEWQEGFQQIQQQIARLLSEIATWEQTYLLRAPTDGFLIFNKRPSSGQFLSAGTTIFNINPNKSNPQLLAIGKLSGNGIGKAKNNMTTLIRLNAYPYKEYGELKGHIQNISNVPSQENGQNYYQIEIQLPNQLKSTFDQEITFRQEMSGLARIVTKNQSLLQRFYSNLIFRK